MLAFLGLTLVVLVATLGLARWSFEHGFRDYVNALEQTRLAQASEDIAELYINNNKQWDGIDKRQLQNLTNNIPFDFDDPESPVLSGLSPSSESPSPSFGRPPPPRGGMRPEGLPPQGMLPPDGFAPHELEGQSRPRGRPAGKPSPPTAVFELDGSLVVGPDFRGADDELMVVPIEVDGQQIGTVKSEPKRRFNSPIETAFARQQVWTSGFIGLASLLLAAAVSWWLTQLLLSPVRRMIQGINRLSKGDYSQPLTSEGRHDEFGQLVGDINHLTKTLEKNQTSRRRWIADISHELRTPMAILTGEIEALKDGIRPFDKQQLQSLDQEIQRLRHLTDDLYQLSVSDIGGLRYEFANIDLRDSIDEIIGGCQLNAAEQGLELVFESGSSQIISADANRMNQLLLNLIRNSMAYTDAPGRIQLVLEREAGNALLTICDTPPGCGAADCEQLFDPLYRQDASRSRRSAGAGLGLAICRNIVEAHRGTISASPSSLGGLKISILLPLAETQT
jgi:two-component system sensor histidine kinase BaeS